LRGGDSDLGHGDSMVPHRSCQFSVVSCQERQRREATVVALWDAGGGFSGGGRGDRRIARGGGAG
jgi:hypothetical protein